MGGSSTTRTEPWAEQKEYLKTGFGRAGELLREGAAPYYGGPTMAGFDPAQQQAQASMLGYAGGPRPKAMQKTAENYFQYSKFANEMEVDGVLRNKIDVSELERLPGGSVRDVYKISDNKIVKVAKLLYYNNLVYIPEMAKVKDV